MANRRETAAERRAREAAQARDLQQARSEAAEAAREHADAVQDRETAEAVVAAVDAARRKRRWFEVPGENVTALCALILSLIVGAINVFYAMRGPEVVVQKLDSVLLYRDGGAEIETEGELTEAQRAEADEAAVLAVAVPLMMINAASAEHGDVLVEAMVRIADDGGRYPYQTLVLPIFTQDAPAAREKCEVGTRCIIFGDLVLVERTDEVIDVPGGSAKSRYLSFPLIPFTCKGDKEPCRRYPHFREAMAEIDGKPASILLELDFHSDGRRTITCEVEKADLSYLRDHGWTALPCARSEVADERWFAGVR